MIRELRHIKPFIHFGLHRVEAVVESEQSIDVWMSTLYNLNDYTISITTTLPKTKISEYRYRLTPITPGTYTIFMKATSKGASKDVDVQSNIITLIVT